MRTRGRDAHRVRARRVLACRDPTGRNHTGMGSVPLLLNVTLLQGEARNMLRRTSTGSSCPSSR
jgi:hypothetical protein